MTFKELRIKNLQKAKEIKIKNILRAKEYRKNKVRQGRINLAYKY